MSRGLQKQDRKEYICEKAYEELLKTDISQFSLNKFIALIEMSKGQFYYYFKTKEDLICKIIDTKCFEVFSYKYEQTKYKTTFLEKLSTFFSFFIEESDPNFVAVERLLKNTFHLYINTTNKNIQELNRNFYQLLLGYIEDIIEEMIENGSLKEDARKFPRSIIATADGMYLHSLMDNEYDIKTHFTQYLISLDQLLQKNTKGTV
ncbi:MAG: TetR/AcrR family transcriptional regulator [Arcobacteraceae bacterium]